MVEDGVDKDANGAPDLASAVPTAAAPTPGKEVIEEEEEEDSDDGNSRKKAFQHYLV